MNAKHTDEGGGQALCALQNPDTNPVGEFLRKVFYICLLLGGSYVVYLLVVYCLTH